MNWERLKLFYEISRYGSFTRAAAHLNITQSALSRTIQKLEYELKTKLFHRIHSGLELTHQGRALHEIANKITFEIEAIEPLFYEQQNKAEGPLRIATTNALSSMWIPYYVKGFLQNYPKINLFIKGDDNELDLNVRQADASIRPLIPYQSDLIQQYLLTFSPKLYASPKYLEEFGAPQKIEDLKNHRLITYNDAKNHPYGNLNWILNAGNKVEKARKSYLTINLGHGLLQMAEQGIGIIAISDQYPSVKNSSLVQILPEWVGPETKIYYSYPKQMKNYKRVSVFGDYIKSVIQCKKDIM